MKDYQIQRLEADAAALRHQITALENQVSALDAAVQFLLERAESANEIITPADDYDARSFHRRMKEKTEQARTAIQYLELYGYREESE